MLSNLDPLDIAANEVDLSYPLAPASNYQMSIFSAEKLPNRKGTGDNLKLVWKSVSEITSTKGDTMRPGTLTVTQYVGLAETDKRSRKDIAKDLVRLIKGGGLPGDTTPSAVINNPTLLTGKTMLVKVGIRQATSDYAESNEVKGVVIEG
jgi:hypothetical protein